MNIIIRLFIIIMIITIVIESFLIGYMHTELDIRANQIYELTRLKWEVYDENDRLAAQFEDEKEAREFGKIKRYEVVRMVYD